MIKYAFVFGLILTVLITASCTNKSDEWSSEQREKWLSDCNSAQMDTSLTHSDREKVAAFCNCMYDVTSRSYTPEEAGRITEDQQRKLIQICNYTW